MTRPFRIPLAPHDPAGAIDVGLAACGAAPTLFLRLAAAGGLPAAILAEAAGRAFGHGWAVAAAAVLFVTAPLGARVATLAVRGTFDPDPPAAPPPRTKRRRTLEAALSAACVLLGAAYLAPRFFTLPTAAAALAGPVVNGWVGVALAAAVGLRASSELSRRAPLPAGGAKLVAARLARRALWASPLGLFLWDGWEPLAWLAAFLWGPFALAILGRGAFRSERLALRAISARLHDGHADALVKAETFALAGRALGTAVLCGGLWAAAGLTFDLTCSALRAWRPVLGQALEAPAFWRGLAADPTAAAVGAGTAVGVYVVGRVGWFATLVDLRVRRDCWDVQQSVMRERDRLAAEEARATPPLRSAPSLRAPAALSALLLAPAAAAAQSPAAPTAPAEVARRADAVLARDEFRHLRDFADSGDGLFPPVDGRSPLPGAGGNRGAGGSGGAGSGTGGGGGTTRRGNRTTAPASGGGGAAGAAGPGLSAGATALGGAVGVLLTWVAGAVLVGLAGLLVWAIVRAIGEREQPPEESAAAAAGGAGASPEAVAALPPDRLLGLAREHAAAGRFAEAVGTLLTGLTGRVEAAGLIRPRRGLTAREYLRAARPDPRLHPALDAVVRVYEPLGYGRRPGRAEHFARAEAAYLGVLDGNAAAGAGR